MDCPEKQRNLIMNYQEFDKLEKAVFERDYDHIITVVKQYHKTDTLIQYFYNSRIAPENFYKDSEKVCKIVHEIITDIVIQKTKNWFYFPKEYSESYDYYVRCEKGAKHIFMPAKQIILTLMYLSGITKRKAGYLVGKSSGHTSTIYAMNKIKDSTKYENNTSCAFIDCYFSVKKELKKQKLIP